MRDVQIPEKADFRKVAATLQSIVERDKHLIAAAEQLHKIHDADSIVAAAKVELADIQAKIGNEQARVDAANKAADQAVAAAQQRADAAEQAAAASIARTEQAQTARIAEIEAQVMGKIDDLNGRRVAADNAAATAEQRLREVEGKLAAAEQRRGQVRADLEAIQRQF